MSAILVIDSGIGGISILNTLQAYLPDEDFIYFADYAYLPYGKKSTEFLCQRCEHIVDYFIRHTTIKAVVIACNTATVAAIKYLRAHFSIPFFGIEPGIKPAAGKSKKGILVLATELTLKSQQFNQLVKLYAANKPIHTRAAPELVDLVENHDIQENPQLAQNVIRDILDSIESEFDTLLLGCTHFSFLKDYFEDILAERVQIIDTSDAIASWVYEKLKQDGMLNTKANINSSALRIFYSNNEKSHDIGAKIMTYLSAAFHVKNIECIELSEESQAGI